MRRIERLTVEIISKYTWFRKFELSDKVQEATMKSKVTREDTQLERTRRISSATKIKKTLLTYPSSPMLTADVLWLLFTDIY